MAAIRQGIMIGYTSSGSITSRSRIFTVSALNMVPITVNPQVPRTSTSTSGQNCRVHLTL